MSVILYSQTEPETLLTDAATMRATGFDHVMELGMEHALDDDGLFLACLDALWDNGIGLFMPLRTWTTIHYLAEGTIDYDSIAALHAKWHDHPAWRGWYTCDEKDGTAYNVAVRQAVYSYLKAMAPTMTVHEFEYRCSGEGASYAKTGTHDGFGGDMYPWHAGESTETALAQLESNIGAPGVPSGTTDFLADLNAIGGHNNELTWCVQTMGRWLGPGYTNATYPDEGFIAAEIAALAAAGWFVSGNVWAFVWTDYEGQIHTGKSLRDAPAWMRSEFATATASYRDHVSARSPLVLRDGTLSAQGPVGERTVGQLDLNTGGGTLRVTSGTAGRFEVSADGVAWDTEAAVADGADTAYVGVTPQAGDESLVASLAVPL